MFSKRAEERYNKKTAVKIKTMQEYFNRPSDEDEYTVYFSSRSKIVNGRFLVSTDDEIIANPDVNHTVIMSKTVGECVAYAVAPELEKQVNRSYGYVALSGAALAVVCMLFQLQWVFLVGSLGLVAWYALVRLSDSIMLSDEFIKRYAAQCGSVYTADGVELSLDMECEFVEPGGIEEIEEISEKAA